MTQVTNAERARIILDKVSEWEPLKIDRWDWATRIITKIEPDIKDSDTEVTMLILIVHETGEIKYQWHYKKGNNTGIADTGVPNIVQAIDYLRSKSYDCGYGNIKSLIAAGLAVKKVGMYNYVQH